MKLSLILKYKSSMDVTRHLSTLRLKNIQGSDGKCNDILFREGITSPKSSVIFFGGDLQNYKECMKEGKYLKWSLDDTSELLSTRFQESSIWLVKSCAFHENTYSIYKNFVISGNYGIPTHSSGQKSWHHLYLLVKNSLIAINQQKSLNYEFDMLHLLSYPIYIVGFSKGCVVLNQLVYDLKDDNSSEVKAFVDQVKVMYWLDGGHGGTSNTWITDVEVLNCIPKHGISVETHVTPYQIKDKARPWIAKEYKFFITKLKEIGASVDSHTHFKDSPRSLDNHFSVLESF